MDNDLPPEGPTRAGTAGGTVLVLLTLSGGAVVETAVLAAIGAIVSYSVSLGLRSMQRWWQKRSSTQSEEAP